MEDSASGQSGPQNGAARTIVVGIMLFLYPLSPGPVARSLEAVYGRSVPPHVRDRFAAFYYPLIVADKHFTPIHEFYEWYFKLWKV